MQITLDTRLKPWLVASKDETRPALGYVQVSRAPAGEANGLMAATDTRRMVVVPCHLEDVPEKFESIVIPATWLDTIHRARPAGFHMLCVDLDLDRMVARALTKTGTSETPLGAGTFPNWLRVIDGEFCRPSCPAAQDNWHRFSPKQLAEVAAALGVENGDPVSWFQREPAAPLVVLPDETQAFAGIGLLMPANGGNWDDGLRVKMAERWLCPRIGEATLALVEAGAA